MRGTRSPGVAAGRPTPGRPGRTTWARFFAPLSETRIWALLALRGYLALVFFQAAIGHLGVPPAVLASQWTPHGAFQGLGNAVTQDPAGFVDGVIALELALALSMTIGALTRFAGFGGLLLNAFFFAAFEWADRGQLYLSWDAALAALWLVVLLTAPGRYLGVGQILLERFPRLGPWLA